jgi:hypothetical protein
VAVRAQHDGLRNHRLLCHVGGGCLLVSDGAAHRPGHDLPAGGRDCRSGTATRSG